MNEAAARPLIYIFGSVTGWTFAFVLFAGITAFIGFAFYRVTFEGLTRSFFYGCRRAPAHALAALIGLFAAVVLFAMVHDSSLDGFHEAAISGDEVELTYILPERSVKIPLADLCEASEDPTFKGKWRLRVATKEGERYESANTGYRSVHEAFLSLSGRIRSRNTARRPRGAIE